MNNQPREWDPSIKLKDFQVAVDICVGESFSRCINFTVTNNIATGGAGIGFTAPTNNCTMNPNSLFVNNTAHSYEAGLIAHVDAVTGGGRCGNLTRFTAHHNSELGVQSIFNYADLKFSELILIDNEVSLTLGLARGDT